MTVNNIQNLILKMGESGCFYLCYVKIAEKNMRKNIDIIEKAYENIAVGNIYFNFNDINDPKNFYIENAEGLLYNLTGRRWYVTKEAPDFIPDDKYFFWVYKGRNKYGQLIYHAECEFFLPIEPSANRKGWEPDSLRVCVLR